ncbi:MAG: chemotaxis protein CheW [Alphaproteobacteria bacterium]|nr:chemotaxis protein CheW [Alphaproteobacteria bacterium]
MSSGALVVQDSHVPAPAAYGALKQEFVTLRLDQQLFGISVMAVQDVLRKQPISPVPLAPHIVAGSLNLRGRIVTAIDLRKRLSMDDYPNRDTMMKVVVEYQHELFAFMVDAVGDVLTLEMSDCEKPPSNMNESWRSVAAGVFKLQDELLVVLDVGSVIDGAS